MMHASSFSRARPAGIVLAAALWILVGGTALAPAAGFPCSVSDGVTGATTSDLPAALAAATAGDTLHIHGTCTGNFTVTVPLTMVGDGPSVTLDGSGHGTVLTIDVPSGTVNINTLKITGGSAVEGGGISADPGTSDPLTLNMVNDRVTGDLASSAGAGLYTGQIAGLNITTSAFTHDTVAPGSRGAQGAAVVSSAPADLFDSNFVSNSATAAAGYAVVGGDLYLTGAATLNALNLNDTTVSAGEVDGGAVAATGPLDVIYSTVMGNTATTTGAGRIVGVGMDATGPSAQVQTTAFFSNSATSSGGAIAGVGLAAGAATQLSMTKSSVYDNQASSETGEVTGVGIDGGAPDALTNTGVFSNQGHSSAGEVDGGGVDPGSGLSVDGGLINRNSVSSSAASADGGGIFTRAAVTVTDATVSGNSASTGGGGVFDIGAPLTIKGSSLTGDTAPAGAAIDNQGGAFSSIASLITGSCIGCG